MGGVAERLEAWLCLPSVDLFGFRAGLGVGLGWFRVGFGWFQSGFRVGLG